jgi:bisphosphoglycerate-dependent phosphoglycerate mutase
MDADARAGAIDALVNGDDSDWAAEQVRIDAWIDAECPPVEDWLAGKPTKPERKKTSLPPSELQHLLALTKRQAGQLLGGKSEDWIEKYVLPHVKTVRQSRSVLIPASELQRFVHESASKAL